MPAHKETAWIGPPLARMWLGVLLAPVAMLTHMLVNYSAVSFVCRLGALPAMVAVSAVCLALAALGFAFALIDFRSMGSTPRGSGGRHPIGRGRFMSILGLLTSGLFALIIVMQAAALFIVDPCTF